ncbi:hypothetical protein QJS10_CPA16g01137 [Acorus calamus]|uniref:P-loop containing nucleoside triphosphate hydrolases superfamily protein n=1 Tax=Acorus calamus TaxID=4465 RepID=A0AAV9D1G3_ACOCL|nr:hypothetical protein QJS10_CPA16g01137 [Acorus calamus]
MAVRKLCYIVVVDDDEEGEGIVETIGKPRVGSSFWYTQTVLQTVLQLVGCKAHHAVKISRRVFDIFERENLQSRAFHDDFFVTNISLLTSTRSDKFMNQVLKNVGNDPNSFNNKLFGLYKKLVSMKVTRERFLDAICSSLEEYHYVGPSQRSDVMLACRLREKKESVTILLCGTSGCGKSTLSSLLASRLGITTVVSTDSIRHMMRSFVDEKENPLLWASTYHAGEFLDPAAVAQAKARKKDGKSLTGSIKGHSNSDALSIIKEDDIEVDSSQSKVVDPPPSPKQVGSKLLTIEGYKAQSEMVIESLDRLIKTWEDRRQSVVVEGVHLSLNFVRQGSLRRYMAIVNSDGSVAKAWPFSSVDRLGQITSSNGEVGCPIYGSFQGCQGEHINVQFGNFGVGSWPNDREGTSYKAGGDEEANRCSSTSSPLHSDGNSKELIDEAPVSESEEEHLQDEEADFSDTTEVFGDSCEGSVTESSGGSDEEIEEDNNEELKRFKDENMTAEEQELHKGCQRTLSMSSSKRAVKEGRRYGRRCHSLPLHRNSRRTENVKAPVPSVD